MNKRLLIVGSSSIHVYNFIALVQSYFDEVLLISNQARDDQKIKVEVLDFHLGLRSLQTIKQIRNIVQKFKPTHIHIHQANTYAFLTLLAVKNHTSKKVLNAWGSDILLNPKKNIFLKEMVKYSLKNVDVLVADSDTVLKEATKYISTIQTQNVNFGIDTILCNSQKEKIIYSNRLHKPLYNIDKVLISFSKFVKQHSDWRLVLAGNGEETEKLKSLAEGLCIRSKVDFIGFVDKKTNFEYYCKSKIYVSIPNSDSISLSLVEAIISDCIVFVSDLEANHEIVDCSIGFIENDLENIHFMQYQEIDRPMQKKRISTIKKLFSKEYNRQRYIEIYEN